MRDRLPGALRREARRPRGLAGAGRGKAVNPTESLRQRIVAGLHLGTLNAGDRLQSVRQVATEFGVNPRVVMAAYRQLAAEGLVRMRSRSGVFVELQWTQRAERVLL